MNNELRISILFSFIVVYNLFSSLKYTILLWICLSQAQKEQERGVRENVVQNVKKRKNRSEIERGSIETSRIRASLDGVNNKDNEPATSTSAQPPPLAPISDNLQYSDFPVIQKFHFYRASLRHTLFFFHILFTKDLH
jgi:hypothetical protein